MWTSTSGRALLRQCPLGWFCTTPMMWCLNTLEWVAKSWLEEGQTSSGGSGGSRAALVHTGRCSAAPHIQKSGAALTVIGGTVVGWTGRKKDGSRSCLNSTRRCLLIWTQFPKLKFISSQDSAAQWRAKAKARMKAEVEQWDLFRYLHQNAELLKIMRKHDNPVKKFTERLNHSGINLQIFQFVATGLFLHYTRNF